MRRVNTELQSIIREMEPELNPGVYVYSVVPTGAELGGIDAVAAHHDHIFVPIELVDPALALLRALQRSA